MTSSNRERTNHNAPEKRMNQMFSENLIYLRKRDGYTQEQLSEKLDVSRQSVSKWESGAAMPELEKLTVLSQLFDTSMDDLVRSDISFNENRALRETSVQDRRYNDEMDKFSLRLSAGVGMIIAGVALLVLLSTFTLISEAAATALFLFVLACGVGLVIYSSMTRDAFLKGTQVSEDYYTKEEEQAFRHTFNKLITGGVVLILLGVVLLVLSSSMPEVFITRVTSLFLLFVAVATAGFVWGGTQLSKYNIKEVRSEYAGDGSAKKKGGAGEIIMPLAVAGFLLWGFLGDGWSVAWVLFPVCAILSGVVDRMMGKED